MFEVNLINKELVVKMQKTYKKVLLIGIIGLIILGIIIYLISISFFAKNAFYIFTSYILLTFIGYILYLVLSSRKTFIKVRFEEDKIILLGTKEKEEHKLIGLSYVEADYSYFPDVLINFVYSENNQFNFMIHKESIPVIKKYLDEKLITHNIE